MHTLIHYLIRTTVPAAVKGTGSVLWGQNHHHQVVTGPGREEENHHGSHSGGLAHGRTLQEEAPGLTAAFRLMNQKLTDRYGPQM